MYVLYGWRIHTVCNTLFTHNIYATPTKGTTKHTFSALQLEPTFTYFGRSAIALYITKCKKLLIPHLKELKVSFNLHSQIFKNCKVEGFQCRSYKKKLDNFVVDGRYFDESVLDHPMKCGKNPRFYTRN